MQALTAVMITWAHYLLGNRASSSNKFKYIDSSTPSTLCRLFRLGLVHEQFARICSVSIPLLHKLISVLPIKKCFSCTIFEHLF